MNQSMTNNTEPAERSTGCKCGICVPDMHRVRNGETGKSIADATREQVERFIAAHQDPERWDGMS